MGKALCDLGASVNVLSSFLYKNLVLTEMKHTEVILQLADKSVKKPFGLVKDVMVKFGALLFPANFVVLDYVKGQMAPLILERPFLATAGAIIDLSKCELSMEVDGKR